MRQSVAEIMGTVFREEQPANASCPTANRSQESVDPFVNVVRGHIGSQYVVSRRPVGDNPCGLLVYMNTDPMLAVKQAKICDVVLPQSLYQLGIRHVVR